MTDRELIADDDRLGACCEVPLVELLRRVPVDAVHCVNTPNALGFDTHSIPIGPMCHNAASVLDRLIDEVAALRNVCQVVQDHKGFAEAWAYHMGRATPAASAASDN